MEVRFVIELMSITVMALYKGKLEGKLGLYEENLVSRPVLLMP